MWIKSFVQQLQSFHLIQNPKNPAKMSKFCSNQNDTVCKEVCSVCKCIVKEKPINNNNNKKKDCTATIVGVINLPEECCRSKINPNKGDCEVFRDMGECLQKCILKVSKKSNNSGSSSNSCGSSNMCGNMC